MVSTIEELSKLSAADFELLATAILREAQAEYAALVHPGVNSEGKTVKAPVDGIGFVAGANPPHMIAVHHTTFNRDRLRRKWLHDPAPVNPQKGKYPVLTGRVERAKYLLRQRSSGGAYRHEMEKWTPDLSKSKEKVRLPCPLRPPHARNIDPTVLRRAIESMSRTNPASVRSASGIFAHLAERGAWVRFDSIAHSAECDRFLEFLLELNIGGKQIELISGDSSRDSAIIREWSRVRTIRERALVIKPSGDQSRNFPLKTALYVRPKFGSRCKVVDVNPAGYRFAMEMAFVAFGKIQESEPR